MLSVDIEKTKKPVKCECCYGTIEIDVCYWLIKIDKYLCARLCHDCGLHLNNDLSDNYHKFN